MSVEFKLYLIKEFQRLQEAEQKQLGWDVKRNLTKINYRIHTDAIRAHLIPPELSGKQTSLIYASEADVLNMALFGRTAKDWREANPDEKGNIRDQANASQLVCLANLENLNALFINEGMPQPERLRKLNHIAIEQMEILTSGKSNPRHPLKKQSVTPIHYWWLFVPRLRDSWFDFEVVPPRHQGLLIRQLSLLPRFRNLRSNVFISMSLQRA